MKPQDVLVRADDERPVLRPEGGCGYCPAKLGEAHAPECVCRCRTVVMRFTVDLVRRVPEHWTPEQINFHANESSWCADNAIREMAESVDRRKEKGLGCFCPTAQGAYVREATDEDERQFDVHADVTNGR